MVFRSGSMAYLRCKTRHLCEGGLTPHTAVLHDAKHACSGERISAQCKRESVGRLLIFVSFGEGLLFEANRMAPRTCSNFQLSVLNANLILFAICHLTQEKE